MFRRSASRITSLLIRKRRVLPWRRSGHAPFGALLLVGGVGGFGAPLVSVLTPPGQTDLHAATARQALSPDDPDDVETQLLYRSDRRALSVDWVRRTWGSRFPVK